MYCNKCGKEFYGEYEAEEYNEVEEVEAFEFKAEDAKFEERKEYDKKPDYRPEPCHKCCKPYCKPYCKPEPICNEWDQEYVCKFTAKCFPKKQCKPCHSCCGKR